MTIEKTLDLESTEILRPEDAYSRIEGFPEVVISTFSQKTIDIILDTMEWEEVCSLDFGKKPTPVYVVSSDMGRFALFFSHLGGPAAGAQMEEIIVLGGKKFLYFGTCGCLDKEIESGSIVVPTAAYRDEGTSYHYLPSADFIDLETSQKVGSIIKALNIPMVETKVWTTDALYRETINNVRKRREVGCHAVDMECASLAAVAKFRGVEFAQFLYAEDNLDGECWEPGLLGKFTKSHRENYIYIGLEIVKKLYNLR